ncbi:MAG: hypothetical protein ACRDK2_09485 [Solirubrobacteraceae bacterium]
MQLARRDVSDLLRCVGGVTLAAGAVLVLVRKSSHHGWGSFALLLVALVPTIVLYVLALGALEPSQSKPPKPWQSVLMVAAILLVPLSLLEFLRWVGASTHHILYSAAIFAITALLAGYGVRRARVPIAALLASLSLLVTWLLVCEKILGHPSANTYRWLLVAAGVSLLLTAGRLAQKRAIGAGEVATTGAIAAIAAGVLGVIIGVFVGTVRGISGLVEPQISSSSSVSGPHTSRFHPGEPLLSHTHLTSQPEHSPLYGFTHTSGLQHPGWDVYLLVVSLLLLWIGSRARVRGLGYVGGVGLLAFLISVGAQVTRLESGRSPTTGILGWPIALLIIGVVGLVLAMVREPSD